MNEIAGNAEKLLQKLIALDSTSSRSNLPVIELLESELGKLGFIYRRQEWKDSNGVHKANLVAYRGQLGKKPGLALVGHSDCVPFDPNWKGALAGELQGSANGRKLFGRGSADTKGFIAAALAACATVREHAEPLMFISTADEEVGCLGAKQLLELFRSDGEKPRRAIVGEPTRMIPILGHKGYCLAEIELTGAEGHSAFPDTGASAILAAGRMLRELESLGERLKEEADPRFAPPYTTLNVGLIQGGTAKNVIPGSCKLTLEWRPIPGQEVTFVLKEVEKLCAQATSGKIRAQIRALRMDAGIAVKPGELIQFLEGESGNKTEAIPFGTELPQLSMLGAEACVFGPGDIRVAHQTGEFIPLEEFHKAIGILGRAIGRFCG